MRNYLLILLNTILITTAYNHARAGTLNANEGPLKIKPSQCFRISDHGNSSESINLNIEKIDYSKIVIK